MERHAGHEDVPGAAEDLIRRLEDGFTSLLHGSRGTVKDASLRAARALGRQAIALGLTVVEVARLQGRACRRVLGTRAVGDAAEWVAAADAILAESFTPYENVHLALRAANSALRTSGEQYRDLLENVDIAVFAVDLGGRLTSVNHAGVLLTGYQREDMVGRGLDLIVPPGKLGLVRSGRELRLRGPRAQSHVELELVTLDGRCVPVLAYTRPMLENGKPIGMQVFVRDVTDRKHAEAAIRHLTQFVERKMKRISHALHDEASQVLAALYLRIDEIACNAAGHDRRHLQELRALVDQVHDQLRRLSHELRPAALDDFGLLPACRYLAEGVSKRAKLKVDVKGSTGGRLSPEVEIAVYRVVQEALSNVAKHAGARNVTVEFERQNGSLTGRIRDNGQSFDVARVMSRKSGRGLGFVGMQERLMAVAGRLRVTSTPYKGTSVEFAVPVEE
jgi:PAS domain S-box-containing protein